MKLSLWWLLLRDETELVVLTPFKQTKIRLLQCLPSTLCTCRSWTECAALALALMYRCSTHQLHAFATCAPEYELTLVPHHMAMPTIPFCCSAGRLCCAHPKGAKHVTAAFMYHRCSVHPTSA
eukprot:1160721-Pelagomonas_calceolata.AAC.6